MSGWGSNGKKKTGGGTVAPSFDKVNKSAYGLSDEFEADNVVRMPSIDDSLEAAARLRRELFARSGRDSTRLVGTGVYGNRYFGDVG
jgi:hypothetical protein